MDFFFYRIFFDVLIREEVYNCCIMIEYKVVLRYVNYERCLYMLYENELIFLFVGRVVYRKLRLIVLS